KENRQPAHYSRTSLSFGFPSCSRFRPHPVLRPLFRLSSIVALAEESFPVGRAEGVEIAPHKGESVRLGALGFLPPKGDAGGRQEVRKGAQVALTELGPHISSRISSLVFLSMRIVKPLLHRPNSARQDLGETPTRQRSLTG